MCRRVVCSPVTLFDGIYLIGIGVELHAIHGWPSCESRSSLTMRHHGYRSKDDTHTRHDHTYVGGMGRGLYSVCAHVWTEPQSATDTSTLERPL